MEEERFIKLVYDKYGKKGVEDYEELMELFENDYDKKTRIILNEAMEDIFEGKIEGLETIAKTIGNINGKVYLRGENNENRI